MSRPSSRRSVRPPRCAPPATTGSAGLDRHHRHRLDRAAGERHETGEALLLDLRADHETTALHPAVRGEDPHPHPRGVAEGVVARATGRADDLVHHRPGRATAVGVLHNGLAGGLSSALSQAHHVVEQHAVVEDPEDEQEQNGHHEGELDCGSAVIGPPTMATSGWLGHVLSPASPQDARERPRRIVPLDASMVINPIG